MTIEQFIHKIEDEIEDIEHESLKPGTIYRDIENWSSMYALFIIAIIDEGFEVEFTTDDFSRSNTIEDIYNIVLSKLK